jgi:hypothetical protein
VDHHRGVLERPTSGRNRWPICPGVSSR